MANKKTARRALFTSVISLILCCCMLVGTTFAWFTDSVTSANNIIKSGTLNAGLYSADELASDSTAWKDASQGAIFDYKLWEPGYTMVKYVKITNEGNLAYKFRLDIIPNAAPVAGKANLADVIDVYMFDPTATVNRDTIAAATPVGTLSDLMTDADGAAYGVLLPAAGKGSTNVNTDTAPKGEIIYCIALKMQETAGNEYQDLSVGEGFRVQLMATQYTWEKDSFDHEYDEGVEYPYVVSTPAELNDALTAAGAAGAGDSTIVLAGDIDMTDTPWTPIKVDGYNGADIVTIDGNGATITGLTAPLFAGGFAGGSGIVIKNLTIAGSDITSTNTIGSGAFIESVDSMARIELINCHLKNSTVTGGPGSRTGGLIGWTAGYNNVNDGPVKTYVTIKDCSVTNCTITCDGSVGGIYGHAGNNAWTYSTIKDCEVTNCILNSTDDGGWRVGVVVGTANVGEVTISGITESGNTLTQTGKTAPAGQSNLYGRFVPGTTGKLVINGTDIAK